MRKVYLDQLPSKIQARFEACDFDWLVAGDLWDKSFWDEMLADWTYHSSCPKSSTKTVGFDKGSAVYSPEIWIVDYCRELPRLPSAEVLESFYGRPDWLKDLEACLQDFDHYHGRVLWWQTLEVLVQGDYLSVVGRHRRRVTCPDLQALEM